MDEEAPSIRLDDSRFPYVEVVVVDHADPEKICEITNQIAKLCERGRFTLQWTFKRTCPRISESDRAIYLQWYRSNRALIDRNILAVGVVLSRPVHRAAFIAFSWLAKSGPFFRGFLGQQEAKSFLTGVLKTHRLQVPHEESNEQTPGPISMLH